MMASCPLSVLVLYLPVTSLVVQSHRILTFVFEKSGSYLVFGEDSDRGGSSGGEPDVERVGVEGGLLEVLLLSASNSVCAK